MTSRREYTEIKKRNRTHLIIAIIAALVIIFFSYLILKPKQQDDLASSSSNEAKINIEGQGNLKNKVQVKEVAIVKPSKGDMSKLQIFQNAVEVGKSSNLGGSKETTSKSAQQIIDVVGSTNSVLEMDKTVSSNVMYALTPLVIPKKQVKVKYSDSNASTKQTNHQKADSSAIIQSPVSSVKENKSGKVDTQVKSILEKKTDKGVQDSKKTKNSFSNIGSKSVSTDTKEVVPSPIKVESSKSVSTDTKVPSSSKTESSQSTSSTTGNSEKNVASKPDNKVKASSSTVKPKSDNTTISSTPTIAATSQNKKTSEEERKSILTVQVVSLADPIQAQALKGKLAGKGFPARVESFATGGKKYYRVRVGVYNNREDASKIVSKLQSAGYSATISR